MNLLDLPAELILEIADTLQLRHVSSLLRTCHKFQRLLTKHLYRRDVRDHEASSLRWACQKFSGGPAVRKALAAGANANMTWTNNKRRTPNQLTRFSCDYELFTRTSPLLQAASFGNLEIAEILVESGANINSAPCPGFSPIMGAVYYGRKEVVQFLIKKQVNLHVVTAVREDNSASPIRLCPLALAAASHRINCRDRAAIVAILLATIDDADEIGYSCASALFLSVYEERTDIVKLLLDSGRADPNKVCKERGLARVTPLFLACNDSKLDILQLLCKTERTDLDS